MENKAETMTVMRRHELYTKALLLHGNGKLLDFDDVETGLKYRYAQYNTRAVVCCPFRSKGCEKFCYATKGHHTAQNVIDSRDFSTEETKREDFAERVIYTIETELKSKRYSGCIMIIRLHESGDFYSLQYLRKWLKVFSHFLFDDRVIFCFYTKSFPFFLMLTEDEKAVVNTGLKNGRIAMSLSKDDTMTAYQLECLEKCRKAYPLANVYYCTEKPEDVEHDTICDCADCARCGKCIHTTGITVVVVIHSASKNDMQAYRENIRK